MTTLIGTTNSMSCRTHREVVSQIALLGTHGRIPSPFTGVPGFPGSAWYHDGRSAPLVYKPSHYAPVCGWQGSSLARYMSAVARYGKRVGPPALLPGGTGDGIMTALVSV